MEFFAANTKKKVVIGVADFEDAMELKSCILEALAKSDIKIDIEKISSESDIDFGMFIKSGLEVTASRPVRIALMKCLERTTYDGKKVGKGTFDDIDAREDYYEIAFACMKVNLSPFFKGLVSKLKTLLPLVRNASLTSL